MSKLKTTYILRTNKKNKQGKCPIYLRITVNRRRELTTKKYVKEDQWDSRIQRVRGRRPFAKSINDFLDQLERKVWDAETQLLKEQKSVTAKAVKDILKGDSRKQIDLIEFFINHNEKMKELIGNGYAMATFKKYKTCLKHLSNFIKEKYNQSTYLLNEVDLSFIKDFEHYLKTKENSCSHNSALKYISHLKKVIREALDEELITKNPFKRYNETYNDKDPLYLNQEELKLIEGKEIRAPRVDRVRDVYLFCCYTGLSYSDVEKLTYTAIETNSDGEKWIMVNRTKTKEPSKIMLLPIPLKLIEKYKGTPLTKDGNLLPVISNQKTNAYLKEVAGICEIKKEITFHSSRHTFATTVALENGVPIETVQEILGHKDSRSTQRYARVTRKKVGQEMRQLRKVL